MSGLTDAERRLLSEKVKMGSEIDPIPVIPDAPDISPPTKGKIPGTFKNSIDGLVQLKSDQLPEVGVHCVTWGSKLLDDIRPRPVRRMTLLSENAYAVQMRSEAEQLAKMGIKDPLHRGQSRADRAEQYARWRYKGYVCGEVASL